MTITLAFAAAGLFSLGTYLVLQRKLSRIIIGLALLSHGANALLMTSGDAGTAPLIGSGDVTDFSDPLPQAMALTTIVITFGVTALLLAMAYRSWLLTHDDEVEDDVTDRAVGRGGWSDKEVADELTAETTVMADEHTGTSDDVIGHHDGDDDDDDDDVAGDDAGGDVAGGDAGQPIGTPAAGSGER
ncbi:MAG TPA: NADH-quinone oxidoreductase subunit K [Ilumatobacteraceae bacterium]|nr:NADH-quinone oxidoreductase subunit K [Ilumatobacteraceae bacterium]